LVAFHPCNLSDSKFSPSDQFTTTDDIVSAVVKILSDTSVVGKAVEISKTKTYHREQHEYCDDAQEKTMGAAASSF
jgi:hypothetical protein